MTIVTAYTSWHVIVDHVPQGSYVWVIPYDVASGTIVYPPAISSLSSAVVEFRWFGADQTTRGDNSEFNSVDVTEMRIGLRAGLARYDFNALFTDGTVGIFVRQGLPAADKFTAPGSLAYSVSSTRQECGTATNTCVWTVVKTPTTDRVSVTMDMNVSPQYIWVSPYDDYTDQIVYTKHAEYAFNGATAPSPLTPL